VARVYLDHASTTPARPEALAALGLWAALPPGDPGRLHEEGRIVRDALEEARREVATLLGTLPRQVVFTSGATEAINAAVWGACSAAPGAPVLCAAVEHSAVRDASARLAPVEALPVDAAGRLDLDALRTRLRAPGPLPALVHCQWANHEVGTLQPVAEVVALCRDFGVTVHVDAAAACGHVPTELDALGADLVSVSAHKLGGVPGAGALVVRRGSRFAPLLVGGAQERGRRGGLEPIPALLAFGAAAAALSQEGGRLMEDEARASRRRLAKALHGALAVDGVELVGPADDAARLPHLVCLGVHGV
jgi:cysteine desulfurase